MSHDRGEHSVGPSDPSNPEGLVADSTALQTVLRRIDRLAAWRIPVLIVGESGVGKESLARRLHRMSRRKEGPFVAVNCAGLPETLVERELFGSRRGAYTGADRDREGLFGGAEGGTLLLDEVGDLPWTAQAKLLRALQQGAVRPVGGTREHPVDVRVIAATHRELPRMIAEGRFRADLYYRLARAVIRVPPLRERPEDIPGLVVCLTRRLEREAGTPPVRCDEDAVALLVGHPWPGNVRELESVLVAALMETSDDVITAADLEPHLTTDGTALPVAPARPLEREMIVRALSQSGGVLTRAAARIGWSRQKLRRRMQHWKLRGAGGGGQLSSGP